MYKEGNRLTKRRGKGHLGILLLALSTVIGASLLLPHQLHTAKAAVDTCYWVGGDGNWNDTAHWDTDSGGAGGDCDGGIFPGSDDTAVLDANSAAAIVTVNTAVNVASLQLATGFSGELRQGANTITIGSGTAGTYSQAAGTFVGGSSNIDLNGSFTLSAGTFTSTTATFYVATGWTHTAGGTFTHNSGTVTYDNGNATINVNTTEIYNNLYITGGSGKTISTGDTLRVDGLVTFNDGLIDTGTVNAKGTIAINTGWDGGTGNLLIDGAGAQSFTAAAGSILPKTTLNQAATTIDFAAGDAGIYALVLQAGTFKAPSGRLSVRNGWDTSAGGTFNNNSGTVTFANNGAIAVNVNTTETFYDFDFNCTRFGTPGSITIASGDTLVVSHALTLTEGSVDAAAIGTPGYIDADGTISVGATFDGGTGTLLVNGGGDQSFTVADGGQMMGLNLNSTSTTVGFAGANSNFDGPLVLAAGTIVAPTGTLLVYRDFTHSAGGTFTAPDGSTLEAAGNQNVTWDIPSQQLYNFTCNKSGAMVTMTADDTFYVKNNLNLTLGAIALATINVQGNVSVGATYGSAVTGSAKLYFSGGNAQTLSVTTGGILPFGTATVNKTVGTTLTLLTAASFNVAGQDLTIQSGTLDANGNNLTVNDAFTIAQNGTFRLQGGETVPTVNNPPTPGSTVIYNGTGSYTTALAAGNNYANLTFDGVGGTWEPSAALGVDGNLTVNNGTLDIDGNNLAVTGFVYNNANFRLHGNETLTLGNAFDSNSGTVIFDGRNVAETLTVTSVATAFNNLTINDANATKATFSPGIALDVNGDMTITAGTFNTNALDVTVGGSWTNNDTFTGTNSTITFDGTAVGKTISTGGYAFYDMAVSGAGGVWTVAAASNLNVDHDLTISNGTLTTTDAAVTNIDGDIAFSGGTFNAPSGTMTVAGDWTNSGGTFSNGGGTVTLDGNSSNIDVNTTETFSNLTFAPADAQGKVIATGDTLQTLGTLSINEGLVTGGSIDAQNTTTINSNADGITSTLNFTGAGSHNFSSTSKLYGSVTVNKTGGTVTMQTNLDMLAAGQNLTITSGSLNLNGKNLSLQGNFTQGGGTIPATLGIDDTVDNAIDSNVLANSGAIDINGNFTLSSGTFNSTSGTMKIAGNFNHTGGTFNCNGGTVEFDGHDQLISGSTTFCSLTKSTGTARTLTFEAGSTQTVTGTLTLLGNAGQLLSLRSSVDGTSWNLHLTGTPMVSYVDVKDSNLTGNSITPTQSVNSGNNSALWIWGTTPTPTPSDGGGGTTTDEGGYYSYGNRRTTATAGEEVIPEGAATILSREGLFGRGLPWWGWVAAILLLLLIIWLIWMLIVAYRRRKEDKGNKHYGDRLMKSIIWITLFITGSCLLLPQISSVQAQDNNQTTQDQRIDNYLNEMLSKGEQTTQGKPGEMNVSALTVSPTASSQSIDIGATVTFGGTVTGGTITKYEWDFDGDGGYDWSSAVNANTTHTYTLFGVYSATLRGTSSTGEKGTGSIDITVNKKGDVARVEHVNRVGFSYDVAAYATSVWPSEWNMPISSDLDGGRTFIGYTTCNSWDDVPSTACAQGAMGKTWVAMSPEQPGGTWTKVLIDNFTKLDQFHNDPTIVVDGAGYIHIWYGMHNSAWKYARSNSPHTITGGFTSRTSEMTSITSTPQISYPKAVRDQLGRIIFTWRDRGTNNGGASRFGIYDPASGWVRQTTLFDDETIGPHGTPYVVGKLTIYRTPSGRLYTAAPWTDWELGSASGHDLTYAYSDDDGITWRRTDTTAYNLPITRASGSPDIIVTEAEAEFQQVDTAITSDSSGRPFIFFFVNNAGTLAYGNYYMYLQDNNTWSAPVVNDGVIPWWSVRNGSGDNGSILMTTAFGTPSSNLLWTYFRGAGYSWTQSIASLSSGTWATGNVGHGAWSDASAWSNYAKGRAWVASKVSISDAEGYFVEAKVGINSGPTSSGNTIVTDRDVAANLKLMSYDVDENALSYTIVSGPSHGTLSGTAPNLTYTPTADYDGTDSFTFKSNDGTYDSNTATVNITVNEVYHNPTLPSLTNTTITAGDVVAYTTPTATVDAGDTVTYSASGVPAGATFYAGCHTLIWPSTTSQTGNFTITVTATNSLGETTNKSMTIKSDAKVNDGSGKYSPP